MAALVPMRSDCSIVRASPAILDAGARSISMSVHLDLVRMAPLVMINWESIRAFVRLVILVKSNLSFNIKKINFFIYIYSLDYSFLFSCTIVIDQCEAQSPCYVGGSTNCSTLVNDFVCTCKQGYTGLLLKLKELSK